MKRRPACDGLDLRPFRREWSAVAGLGAPCGRVASNLSAPNFWRLASADAHHARSKCQFVVRLEILSGPEIPGLAKNGSCRESGSEDSSGRNNDCSLDRCDGLRGALVFELSGGGEVTKQTDRFQQRSGVPTYAFDLR